MKTLTILILLSAVASFAAAAQQVQQPICPGNALCPEQAKTDHAATPSAPVGHRQPTMNNLTPRARQNETTGNGAPDPLGPLPKICTDC